MTRRITALLLALLLALSLTACGNPAQTMDTIEKTAQTVQQIAEVLNDTEEDTESAALPASEAQEPAEEASEEPAQASDQETAAEETEEAPAAETPAIDEDGVYTSKVDVALYLHTYGHLPSNFHTKKEAEKLGWSAGLSSRMPPANASAAAISETMRAFSPKRTAEATPSVTSTRWAPTKRGAKRIVFSNDGLIYYTEDHYETFELLYGEES